MSLLTDIGDSDAVLQTHIAANLLGVMRYGTPTVGQIVVHLEYNYLSLRFPRNS